MVGIFLPCHSEVSIINGLAYIRQLYNLSLHEFAEKVGVSNQLVSMWERGIKPIAEKRVAQMSEIFIIPTEYFQKELTEADKLEIQSIKLKNDSIANEYGFDDAAEAAGISEIIESSNKDEVIDFLTCNNNVMKLYINMKKTSIAMQLGKIRRYVEEFGKKDEVEIIIDNELKPFSPEAEKLLDIYLALEEIINELIK